MPLRYILKGENKMDLEDYLELIEIRTNELIATEYFETTFQTLDDVLENYV